MPTLRSLLEIDDHQKVDVHQELVDAGDLIGRAIAKMKTAMLADKLQGGTLDDITRNGTRLMLQHLVDNEYAETLKSNK